DMTFRGGFLAIGLFVIVVGCSSDSIRTRVALRQAGANRTELERVLAHYSKNPADSLKLKAAKYLIGNMPLHRSYSGAIENYYDAVDSLIPLVEDKTIFKDRMACLYKEYEPSITLSSDLRTINSDFLISSIDNAFDLWENGKWARHLDFEEFEELLLPYNCVDLQPFSDWEISLRDSCRGGIDTLERECREFRNNPRTAVEEVSTNLNERFIKYTKELTFYPIFRASLLKDLPFGDCLEACICSIQILRSKGLPVSIDYTPQWANKMNKHYWLTMLTLRQNYEAFSPFGVYNEDSTFANRPLSKIYRMTYSPDKELAKRVRNREFLPASLSYIFFKDVSDEYMVTDDVSVRTFKGRKVDENVYVATFNNQEWVAVSCGRKRGRREVSFDKLGRGVIYLPVQFGRNGEMEVLGYPFYLNFSGETEVFHPNKCGFCDYQITRKYPVYQSVYKNKKILSGGCVQSSDSPDFREVKTEAEFPEGGLTLAGFQRVESGGEARYWRFASSDEGRCDMSELIFYDTDGNRLSASLIFCGREVRPENKVNLATAINDDNPLTYFSARGEDDIWVGFDFGRKVRIGWIDFFRRADGNNLYPGYSYDLYRWDCDGWLLIDSFTADRTLSHKCSVPKGDLLWLNCTTTGTESRPFTVDEEGGTLWY
ncbi:MAG: hypothetical protein WCS67_08850, partial [Bacteroidales bacterium]